MTNSTMKLVDFFRHICAHQRLAKVGPSTLRKYRRSVNRFSQSLGREAMLTDLTPANYFAFKSFLGEQASPPGAQESLKHCRIVWEFAHEQGMAQECPFGSPVPMMEGP